ncbi:putative oxidoreductase (secreted protein) [metagenome]|uniref:Putative oxidoreductase ( secreted protein) n=1 Tax=metagenome TaxID=256318 RepID=A0A2P2BZP1_9ZZZZ
MRTFLIALALPLFGLASVSPPSSAAPSEPAVAKATGHGHHLAWRSVNVDTDQQFRGLDALDARHAWVGGSDGGVWKTSNGGRTWKDVSPPDTAGLLFRDVEATDRRHVQVLAIGEHDASRIYRTTDGGRTWALTFVNDDPAAFYDCMAMWPGGRRGLAMSDPVDGRFRIISTRDGGASWQLVDPAGMPEAVEGEFGFAASGTCLVTAGARQAWLGSGGGDARIFHSTDRGRTWSVAPSTIPASDAGGVFSLAFRTPRQGIAVGGDFLVPDNGVDMSAYSPTGDAWRNGGDLSGYRSGVAWLPRTRAGAVAVGPTGTDVTFDGGRSWRSFSDLDFDAVQCTRSGACWASGPEGAVARLVR